MLLVVGVALVDASVTLGCRVNLHLGLDTVLPTPELSDLESKKIMRVRIVGNVFQLETVFVGTT